MRSTQFIDLYKELEDELEAKYSGKKLRYSSVIFEYINSYESAPIRDSLNVCREIRNLLTHNANVGGVPNSRHTMGKAMDFTVAGHTATEVLMYVKKQSELDYSYAIDSNYVHMDVE